MGLARPCILLLPVGFALYPSLNARLVYRLARVPVTGSLAALRLKNPFTTKLLRRLQRRPHGRGRFGTKVPPRLSTVHLPARRGPHRPMHCLGRRLLLHSVTINTPCGVRRH